MFVVLDIQYEKGMRHIAVGLYNIFQHYVINGTIFEKNILNIKYTV